MAHRRYEGLVGSQTQIVNAATNERGLQFVGRGPAGSRVTQERSAGLGLLAAKEAAAEVADLGRILKVQDHAVVALSSAAEGRGRSDIVQIAQNHDQTRTTDPRGEDAD